MHVVDISHPNHEEQIGVVNKTLLEINAFDKPILTVFNKMDLYEVKTFDEWLEPSTKKELLEDLQERWQRETGGHAVFVSALERRNLDLLRNSILDTVKKMYQKRYPYKTAFFQ